MVVLPSAGADWAVGGQADAPSNLVVKARVEEADTALRSASERAAALDRELAALART